jgi:non-heme chloroperoxidase
MVLAVLSLQEGSRKLSAMRPCRLSLLSFFSRDVEESVRSLESLLRLCFARQISDEDLYLMLGYNVSVPPYVRHALFSRSFDNDDLLPKLKKPVMITHGDLDAVIKPAAADQHKAAIAHARIEMIRNAGHAVFWDDAATFNRLLRSFAEGLDVRVQGPTL